MLLTHYWLGFILLAVPISSTFAAPTPPTPPPSIKYTVTVFHANGEKVERLPRPTENLIQRLILDMGPKLGDGSKDDVVKEVNFQNQVDFDVAAGTVNIEIMVYFELSGGKFCTPPRKCYGYLVSTDSGTSPKRFGAVVAQDPESAEPMIVQMPRDPPTRSIIETGKQKFLEFLKAFKLVEDWKWVEKVGCALYDKLAEAGKKVGKKATAPPLQGAQETVPSGPSRAPATVPPTYRTPQEIAKMMDLGHVMVMEPPAYASNADLQKQSRS